MADSEHYANGIICAKSAVCSQLNNLIGDYMSDLELISFIKRLADSAWIAGRQLEAQTLREAAKRLDASYDHTPTQ